MPWIISDVHGTISDRERSLMMEIGKLVRDKIPDILESKDVLYTKRILDKPEFLRELVRKLHEETREVRKAVASAKHEQIIEELADVSEVIRALAQACGIDPAFVEKTRKYKEIEKGGFEKRVFMMTQSR
jgi:predicted house-cleaning noncanonical NTP pyrophosphatase (MazG superfamily)